MPDKNSAITSAPFLPSEQSVAIIMRKVIYALIPGILIYFYFFGWGVLINILLTVTSALAWEALLLFSRSRPIKVYLSDGSAIITGILLALAMPPLIVWWIPVVGTFFAIVAAKHLYGGIGYNPINPAMAGYAIILISFPLEMTTWLSLTPLLSESANMLSALQIVFMQVTPSGLEVDSITAATALDFLKTGIGQGIHISDIHDASLNGVFGSQFIEWVNMAFLLGGLYLLYEKIISWHIPVAVITGIAVLSGIAHLISAETFINPSMHLFAGATMLCAFFIATDPVTAPASPLAKLLYGLGIALIIFVIRTWGGYPDAVAFAILLMNLTVPMLDQYTIPKSFGHSTRHE